MITQSTTIQLAQGDRDVLLDELRAAGAKIKSDRQICCCFHDDSRPSMSVVQGDDATWRAVCHVPSCGFKGDYLDVRSRHTGRPLADIIAEVGLDRPKQTEKPVTTYDSIDDLLAVYPARTAEFRYTDPATSRINLVVVRLDFSDGRKSFRQGHQRSDGRWVWKRPPGLLPLYNRSRAVGADRVVVVEGEKCVHALHHYGVVAVSSPMGSGKSGLADWNVLSAKDAVIWPDNDAAGQQHARDIIGCLESLDPRPTISVVDLRALELPAKGDVVDLIERMVADGDVGIIADTLDVILGGAVSHSPSAALRRQFDETIDGKRKNIDTPWSALDCLGKPFLPETVALLCGHPGAGKSFMVLQLLLHWLERGVPVSAYLLEDSNEFHTSRALSQLTGTSQVTDDEWIRHNPEGSHILLDEHRRTIDRLGNAITCAGDSAPSPSYGDLLAWSERRLKAGDRIIVIDPVTVVQTEKPYVDDGEFLNCLKKMLVHHRASALLVTHPRKGSKGATDLDDLAGGAAWQRFSHTVLFLKSHDDNKVVYVSVPLGGSMDTTANRIMYIRKARNGRGQGAQLAFDFGPRDLNFKCHGAIVKGDGS